VTSCAFIDTVCGGIVSSLVPLEHAPGFADVAPTIDIACVGLGIVSNIALALAGIGRSFLSAIDNAQKDSGTVGAGSATGGAPAGYATGGAPAGSNPTAEGKT
jgi:hypothetical protein